jgi:hypothetical protein
MLINPHCKNVSFYDRFFAEAMKKLEPKIRNLENNFKKVHFIDYNLKKKYSYLQDSKLHQTTLFIYIYIFPRGFTVLEGPWPPNI